MSNQNSPAHILNIYNASIKAATIKCNCQYCNKQTTKTNIKRHEESCYLNPENLKYCPVCNSPIKNYKTSTTCSYSCSNKQFRSVTNNGNWKEDTYRSTCFHYHEKKCIVCEEINLVEVHHLDENHENNDPSNLIPLCPTHHQYWHSRYKSLIEANVQNYIDYWRS